MNRFFRYVRLSESVRRAFGKPCHRRMFSAAGTDIAGMLVLFLLVLSAGGCSDGSGSSSPGTESGATSQVDSDQARSDAVTIRFEDVTATTGLTFAYRNGDEAGHASIVESLGGGCALVDFDLDGRVDLFETGGGYLDEEGHPHGHPGALFRASENWHFDDVTEVSNCSAQRFYSHGVYVADFDADGFRDMLVTGYGGLQLLMNLGDGTFVGPSGNTGLEETRWSTGAGWTDFDSDGDLDLYVARYVDWTVGNHPFCSGPGSQTREVCAPRRFNPLPDTFYVNVGNGTFRDATTDVGLRADGKGLAVITADMDMDGDQDIYVTNDTVPNFFYRNTGQGRFEDASLQSGTSLSHQGIPDGSMGVDLGDFNRDGLPDLIVANYAQETFALYRNAGNGVFQHSSRSTGLAVVSGNYVGWGTVFADFDRDGDEDVMISNGHAIRYPVNVPLLQKPLLLENHTGQRFSNVAESAGPYFQASHMGRGVASADIDRDGDIDLAVTYLNVPATILSNSTPSSNSWIGIQLIGRQSNRDAIGAVLHVQAPGQLPEQLRAVKGGGSYASSSELISYFGLGTADHVKNIRVTWPSGREQSWSSVPAGRTIRLIEGVDRIYE